MDLKSSAKTDSLRQNMIVDGGIVRSGRYASGLNSTTTAALAGTGDAKDSCRAATTTALPSYTFSDNNLTASSDGALGLIDGVTLANGDRLLVKDEVGGNEKYNWLWVVVDIGDGSSPWILTRAPDADTDLRVSSGGYMTVVQGTANGGHLFQLATPDPITLNTTLLTVIDITDDPDGVTLERNNTTGKIRVKDNGITTAKLADDAVTGEKIDEDAVDEFHINSGTLGSGLIGGSGTLIQVNPDNVTVEVDGSNKVSVKDGGITPAKIDPTGASSGDVLTYNGSAVAWEAPAGGSGGDVRVRCVVTRNFSGASEVPNGIPASGDSDGITLTGGEKVLVIQEDDQTLIGTYIVSPTTWARSSDTITAGMQIQVMFGGTTYGSAVFHCRNATDPVIGVDNITFGVSKAIPLTDSVSTPAIVDNAVTNAKLRDSAALSVIGRSANSSGDPADITAGTDHHVFRRSGTSVGFGQIATDGIADDAVTDDKLSHTAVTPGTYTNPTITVNQQGRVTAAASGDGGAIFTLWAGASGITVPANSTRYINAYISTPLILEADAIVDLPRPGLFQNMLLSTSGTQPATGDFTVTVRVNSADTAVQCSVASGGSGGVVQDTTNTHSAAGGAVYCFELTNNASSTSITVRQISVCY